MALPSRPVKDEAPTWKAPDWATMVRGEGRGSRGTSIKAVVKPEKGLRTPMVLGPSTLTPCSRARRTSSACSSAPRASASANPWLITTSRLMPCWAHSTAVSTTRSRPKEMTARSGTSGRSATRG